MAIAWGKQSVRIRRIVQFVAGIALLALLVLMYKPGNLIHSLRGVNWSFALPAILGLVGVHLLQVQTWRHLSSKLSATEMTWSFAGKAYYAGQALGSVTPGNLGSDAYRICAIRGSNWRQALAPVVGQRACSYCALVVLTAAFTIPVLVLNGLQLLMISIAAGVSFYLTWRLGLLRIMKPRSVALARRLGQLLAIPSELTPGRLLKDVGPAIVLSVFFHGFSVGLTYILLLSVHGTAPFLETVSLLLIARIATLIPITPYGLGFQEGALALLLPGVGVLPATALAVSVLNRLAMLATALLGVAVLAFDRISRSQITRVAVELDG